MARPSSSGELYEEIGSVDIGELAARYPLRRSPRPGPATTRRDGHGRRRGWGRRISPQAVGHSTHPSSCLPLPRDGLGQLASIRMASLAAVVASSNSPLTTPWNIWSWIDQGFGHQGCLLRREVVEDEGGAGPDVIGAISAIRVSHNPRSAMVALAAARISLRRVAVRLGRGAHRAILAQHPCSLRP